MQFLILTL
jgi:hypothetical protein